MPARTMGFTLVEVVIVLAILGVIGAVTAPALSRLGREDEPAGSAAEVVRLLRTARRAALERAAPVSVTIEPATADYRVKTDTDDGQLTLAEGTMALGPGVTLAGDRPRAQFAFSRLGSATGDSLTVTGNGTATVVRVSRWSGEVEAVRRYGGKAVGASNE